MYLRTGNLIKDFIIEPISRKKDSKGRAQTTYDTETRAILRGVIADADANAIARYSQTDHPCTHQIVQRGGEAAKPGDRLVRDHAHYYILGVDNIAAMGIATIYYVEERTDLDDGSQF
jgi:hypothetical protein